MCRNARCWVLCKEKIQGKLPDSLFQVEAPNLDNMFFKGSFDEWLDRLCEECPAEIDVSETPEVKLLMARHQDSLQKETGG